MPQTRTAGHHFARSWANARGRGDHARFASQAGQDFLLDTFVFRGRRGGCFLDAGGYDGETGSNTLYFERHLGWSGILIEPVPTLLDRARSVRGCQCLGCAVGARNEDADFLEVTVGLTQMSGLTESYEPALLEAVRADPRHVEHTRRVPVRRLSDILAEAGKDRLDYVSLDVEGGEVAALAGFPFDSVKVTAWSIENNSGGSDVSRLMALQGYAAAGFTGRDEIYLPAGWSGS